MLKVHGLEQYSETNLLRPSLFDLPDRGLAAATLAMWSTMISMGGRLQKEVEVIHVIGERIADLTDLLSWVGRMSFPHCMGRGDSATHSSAPDRGEAGWKPNARDGYFRFFDGGADGKA